jgi:hypothetical protein
MSQHEHRQPADDSGPVCPVCETAVDAFNHMRARLHGAVDAGATPAAPPAESSSSGGGPA